MPTHTAEGEWAPPPWATHIAIRKDGSKVGPAAWHKQTRCYVDEDPAKLNPGDWASAYKESYWLFHPIK